MPAPRKPTGKPKRPAARKRAAAPALANALAEAAWSEADAALAQALAECDALEAAPDAASREDAMAMLAQALSRAARKRGLSRIGAVGAREQYDPKRHELERAGARGPKSVRIIAPGVARGGDVLVRARVAPVRVVRK